MRSYGIYLWHWPIYMVTRPHADVPLTGIPLLVLRLALTLVAAALSYRFVEEPIRHGALERWWGRFRSSSGETRRKLAARFGLAASGITLGLVVIVVGLGDGGSAAVPAGLGNKTSVVIRPGQTTTTTATAGVTAPTTVPPTTVAPVTTLPPTTVTAIGDSVMLGAANQLAAPVNAMFGNQPVTGVNAAESRQFSAGVDLIEQLKNAGQLGQDVVVQLGTNGTVDPGDFDRMMSLLSDRKKVVIINAKVPRLWEQQVNDTLAAGVKKYKNAVLLDWHGFGGQHPEFFYDDGIHLRPEGAAAYAQFVAQALGQGSP